MLEDDELLEWLSVSARAASPEAHDEIVRQLPALLRASVQDRLRERLDRPLAPDSFEGWGDQARPMLQGELEELVGLRSRYESHEARFEPGPGPIEVLLARTQQGEIQMEDAEALAGKADITIHLAPCYVFALSEAAVASAHFGDWKTALPLQRLLLAAIDADPRSAEADQNTTVVESDWVEVAIFTLCEVPDARLLRSARERGDRAVARTEAHDPGRWHALTLHRLGVLHMQPYVGGRDRTNFHIQDRRWRDGFVRHHGPAAFGIPPAEWQMPRAEEALPVAEVYLREAARVAAGRERGWALKALVETLVWRRDLGAEVDVAEVVPLAYAAIESLDEARDLQHLLYLRGVLHRLAPSESGSPPTIAHDTLENLSPGAAIDALLLSAQEEQISAPAQALDRLVKARDLVDALALPAQKTARRKLMAVLLGRANAPEIFTDEVSPPGWRGRLEAIRKRAGGIGGERLAGRALASCLVYLAFTSAAEDLEAEGFQILREAWAADPTLETDFSDVVSQLRADLAFGAGANLANSGDLAQSIDAYLASLGPSAELGLDEQVGDIIDRVESLLERGENELALRVPVGLGVALHQIDTSIKQDARVGLQRVWRLALRMMFEHAQSEGEAALPALALVFQLAKGYRFGVMSRYRTPIDVARNGDLEDLRQRIMELEPQVEAGLGTRAEWDAAGPDPLDGPSLSNDEMVRLSFVWPHEPLPGSTPEVALANLQAEFDARLRVEAWKRLSSREPITVAGSAEVGRRLGEDTVLLEYFIGAGAENELALYLLLRTRDTVALGRISHSLGADPIVLAQGRHRAVFSPLFEAVRKFREGILADPESGPVDEVTAQQLEIWMGGLVGDLAQALAHLKGQGMRHLCIVPHGPLHAFPFHLLGPRRRILADDWTITYLPALPLLFRPAAAPRTGTPLVAVGKSFRQPTPRGLRELPQAVAEAQEVARQFKAVARVEEDATKEVVLDALRHRRYVHIATHGEQNEIASAFSCLYLSPNASNDDRLFAYEIEEIDLTGLDVVTLSACETALGRSDVEGNLWGLAPSLLLAGARTVIGTLWPAEDSACRKFFRTFYQALAAGEGKLAAFRQAQTTVRKDFPEYRDWGTFYLTGDWS